MTQLRLKERDLRTTTVVLLIRVLSGHARVFAAESGTRGPAWEHSM